MDPQFNSVTTNTLESVGRRKDMAKKKPHTSVTYPQKRITGQEKKTHSDPTTSPRKVTRKSGAKKYTRMVK